MLAVCIALILGIPLLDLGIKYYIEKNIPRGKEIPILKENVIVRHVHNEGMALNFLDDHPEMVKWISVVMTVGMGVCSIFFLGRKREGLKKISFSMLLGGAVSNVYDRVVRKYVVDYFGFRTKWKKFTDITFNIGDMFIFAGSLGIILISVFKKR